MDPAKINTKRIEHTLIGKYVWFRGTIWKVISAHRREDMLWPWLTLKKDIGIEAAAKEREVQIVMN